MVNNKLLTDEQKELYSLMLPVYGALVSQKNTAKLRNTSMATLYRERDLGIEISYKKLKTKSKNGTVVYPLQEIVKYLTQSNVKTA